MIRSLKVFKYFAFVSRFIQFADEDLWRVREFYDETIYGRFLRFWPRVVLSQRLTSKKCEAFLQSFRGVAFSETKDETLQIFHLIIFGMAREYLISRFPNVNHMVSVDPLQALRGERVVLSGR